MKLCSQPVNRGLTIDTVVIEAEGLEYGQYPDIAP